MDRIFGRAEDKYVNNYLLYGNSEDSKLYSDEAMTVALEASDAENAFKKGCIVSYDGALCTPIAEKLASGVVSIFILSSAEALALVELKSVEDSTE